VNFARPSPPVRGQGHALPAAASDRYVTQASLAAMKGGCLSKFAWGTRLRQTMISTGARIRIMAVLAAVLAGGLRSNGPPRADIAWFNSPATTKCRGRTHGVSTVTTLLRLHLAGQ
jgi:hypothetical protein